MARSPGKRTFRSWWRGLGRRGRGDARHIALGTFCHVAASLRETGLRAWAGPFDWIFSTPAMIEACLADDFRELLDPERLVSVPAGELLDGERRQGRHPAYEARFGLPPLFNHHDPAASANDRAYFERAVVRLRAAMGRPGRNLLYMMSERSWPEEHLQALAARLAAFPSRNVLVVITLLQQDEGELTEAASWLEEPSILRIDLPVRSHSLGIRFGDPSDEDRLEAVLIQTAEASIAPDFPAGFGEAGRRPATTTP